MATSDALCVNCGNEAHDEWFPVQALKIVEQQPARKVAITSNVVDKMIDIARPLPRENLDRIFTSGLGLLGIDSQDKVGSTLKESGINITKQLLSVPAQVALLTIEYLSGDVDPRRWNLTNKKFWDTTQAFNGKILVLSEATVVKSNADPRTTAEFLLS